MSLNSHRIERFFAMARIYNAWFHHSLTIFLKVMVILKTSELCDCFNSTFENLAWPMHFSRDQFGYLKSLISSFQYPNSLIRETLMDIFFQFSMWKSGPGHLHILLDVGWRHWHRRTLKHFSNPGYFLVISKKQPLGLSTTIFHWFLLF